MTVDSLGQVPEEGETGPGWESWGGQPVKDYWEPWSDEYAALAEEWVATGDLVSVEALIAGARRTRTQHPDGSASYRPA